MLSNRGALIQQLLKKFLPFITQRIVALSPVLHYFPGDSSSSSSSWKLWISVAVVATVLLFGFGIATIYVCNKRKKAELYFNKQV